jgi:peroxiredoxin Q/BCP
MLRVGDEAPGFSGEAAASGTVRLEAFRGRWVVLYFFPKAFTAG